MTASSVASDLASLRLALGGQVLRDHPIGPLPTYRVGGSAVLFAQPIDDRVVISRVLVIVGKPTTTDVHALPVGDDRLELNVYSFERLVAAHEVGVSTY